MIVFGPQNFLEVTAGELGLQTEDELQVCLYQFIFGHLLLVDLANHQHRVTVDLKSNDSEGCCHSQPRMIASYSASLFMAGKPSVKDSLMMKHLGEVRTTSTPISLLFEALSTLRIHPSPESLCVGALRVNFVMKSARTCPLITI